MTVPLEIHFHDNRVFLHFIDRATFSVDLAEAERLRDALTRIIETVKPPKEYRSAPQIVDGAEPF